LNGHNVRCACTSKKNRAPAPKEKLPARSRRVGEITFYPVAAVTLP
jgi:hypothetical protein